MGAVSEQNKEVGNLDAFLFPLRKVVLGRERQVRRALSKDANGKRPGEPKEMGSLEKCFRSKSSGTPLNDGRIGLGDDRMIEQALGKWQPGFADEGASSQHLSFFSPERPLAGLSQDNVDDLQWESGDIPRRGFLRLMMKCHCTERCQRHELRRSL